MQHLNTIFHQLLQLLPRNQFETFVGQHKADKYVKKMTCWNQLSILLYAQAKNKTSLRDIETGLIAHQRKLYHLGIASCARSTLSDANNIRPYEIYESLFYELLKNCQKLNPQNSFKFDNPLQAIDSTTISLCLSLFPWAKFNKTKGAFKLHFSFDIKNQIPTFMVLSGGRENDLAIAKNSDFTFSSDSITVMDRAYIDSKWLYEEIHKKKAFFVVRLKKNMKYFLNEQYELKGEEGVLKDEKIVLCGEGTIENYPEDLRLVTYYDKEHDKLYQFLTNNFKLSAKTIAEIYKARWQIELFFKWIKQHLEIKTFLGTEKNAVLTQIWVAMIYYLLISYIKKQTNFKYSILELTRMIDELLFDTIHIIDILSLRETQLNRLKIKNDPQLAFF